MGIINKIIDFIKQFFRYKKELKIEDKKELSEKAKYVVQTSGIPIYWMNIKN